MVRGGSKGRKKSLLRDLSHERLAPEDFDAFVKETMGGSDRACALVCCSFIENILKDLIETHMRSDWPSLTDAVFDGVTAPLRSFSSRITIAYAMDIIDNPTMAALNAIRNIRNVFAHSEKHRTFDHELIAKEVAILKKLKYIIPDADPRRRYIAACVLTGAALGAEIGRRTKNHAMVKALMAHAKRSSPDK